LGDKNPNQLDKNPAREHAQVSPATRTAGDENAIPKASKKAIKPSKVNRDNANKLLNVSKIHLKGEETHSVLTYDTCNEARRKIRAFLKKDGVT